MLINGLNFEVYTKYLEWLESKDLINIQEEERLGHKSINNTLIYTHLVEISRRRICN